MDRFKIPYDFTKYCVDSKQGIADDKMMLEDEDDAATANWGNAWRMPTDEELQELLDGCSWQWVDDFNGSGKNGQLGTSKTNSATIFLPAAGIRNETELSDDGSILSIWASTLQNEGTHYGKVLFYSKEFNEWLIHNNFRSNGQSVRAVLR